MFSGYSTTSRSKLQQYKTIGSLAIRHNMHSLLTLLTLRLILPHSLHRELKVSLKPEDATNFKASPVYAHKIRIQTHTVSQGIRS